MLYTTACIFHILLMLLFSADTREREQHSAQAHFIGLFKIRVKHGCYWFVLPDANAPDNTP